MSATSNAGDDSQQRDHVGFRLENSWHAFRERHSRSRGHVPTVTPFRGYGVSGRVDASSFPTVAADHAAGDDGAHGWVRILARVVLARPGAFFNGLRHSKVVADGVRGWRNFISPPIPYAEVEARVGGKTFYLDADRGGVLDVRIAVDLEPGWHDVVLISEGSEPATVAVQVIDEKAQSGIICDVDDTVVVTALPRPLLAAWNSFVLSEHARVATPGMAVMMERLVSKAPGGPVLYLSTGAWNAAATLTRFLSRNLYPKGTLLLTDWGPTEHRWFRSGMQHKVDELRRLAEEFPAVRWILIGDDGQHDPEIYAEFAKRHPDQVRAIVIRQLTPSEAVLAGGRSDHTVNATPGVPWVYGPDGHTICSQLRRLGVI
ncbi:App1 family protein [Zhihengliuella halotolerans]|uniref:Phosphatidate phosphatase APP1 n=1 Tax=Zhihengliuella halotolerans TaxID=370736 RepID=A0A4V2G9K1_9MICC|nr:phosphatase domain-containing protein [Zhihengliuella halotolerans]RZU60656.1 phosphatidate phosphatase APP1 [Zhihengliuella halotolerans]